MKLRYLTVTFCVLLALTACERAPNSIEQYAQRNNAPYAPAVNSNRVKVTRISVFQDDLAYGNNRGVYLIQDTVTGQEFIGVSGIGISETWSHMVGKTMTSDER